MPPPQIFDCIKRAKLLFTYIHPSFLRTVSQSLTSPVNFSKNSSSVNLKLSQHQPTIICERALFKMLKSGWKLSNSFRRILTILSAAGLPALSSLHFRSPDSLPLRTIAVKDNKSWASQTPTVLNHRNPKTTETGIFYEICCHSD